MKEENKKKGTPGDRIQSFDSHIKEAVKVRYIEKRKSKKL